MSNCLHCGQETTNPKYCSRSCAACQLNTLHPKRLKRPRFCRHCGVPIHHLVGRRTVCLQCNPQLIDWSKITIAALTGKRRYQKHSRLRELARRTYLLSGRPLCCAACGYAKHFEVCHIRAMNEFTDSTLVSVVNSTENLIALCPNHHWEFDHGFLDLISLGFPDFDHLHP